MLTVDTNKDSVPTHPSTDEPRCFVCYEGIVFIGHMVDDYMGGEVEIFWPVPCRRCQRSSADGDSR
jgi:hypothetical protein